MANATHQRRRETQVFAAMHMNAVFAAVRRLETECAYVKLLFS